MAIENERKFHIPEATDLEQLIPSDAKHQEVTQVYLSPDKSAIRIAGEEATLAVTLTLNDSGESETLSVSGEKNLKAFEDLRSSPLGILGENGEISFDGKNTEIRLRTKNDKAFLTIKKKTKSAELRNEFEFEIPAAGTPALQDQHIADGTSKIEKTRESWEREGSTFEFDNFTGANKGLLVVEVENPSAGLAPDHIAPGTVDVTADKRFGNRQLAEHPYSEWGDKYKEGIGGTEGGRSHG